MARRMENGWRDIAIRYDLYEPWRRQTIVMTHQWPAFRRLIAQRASMIHQQTE